MRSQPALAVLDLSGTTVEDRGQVPQAIDAAFRRGGVAVRPEAVRALRGATKREAIFALVPPGSDRAARADQIYAAFREELSARYSADGVRPIPGALDTFEWLRRHRIRIGLTTGFDRDITDLLLTRLRWSHGVADVIVCGDDVARGRPAPDLICRAMARTGIGEARRVAAVGDTALDLRAGWHAGVGWNIGVLTGPHDRTTLAAEPHTHILDSVASVPAIWTAHG